MINAAILEAIDMSESVDVTVYITLMGEEAPGFVADTVMVSPAVVDPLMATSMEPLLFTPSDTVSVAPLLVVAV